MNRKQRNIYEALFAEPIGRNIAWSNVVSLVKALGGEVSPQRVKTLST